MNLRILKKLSKRAAPLLAALGDEREQFRAEPHTNYTSTYITERKHFERGRSVHADLIVQGEIKKPAKDGKGWVYMHPPSHPLKGTIMVGSTSGYYEPEWEEETAWDALRTHVFHQCSDWDEDGPTLTCRLDTPSDYFREAQKLIGAQ